VPSTPYTFPPTINPIPTGVTAPAAPMTITMPPTHVSEGTLIRISNLELRNVINLCAKGRQQQFPESKTEFCNTFLGSE
jgi:hypothetical protein